MGGGSRCGGRGSGVVAALAELDADSRAGGLDLGDAVAPRGLARAAHHQEVAAAARRGKPGRRVGPGARRRRGEAATWTWHEERLDEAVLAARSRGPDAPILRRFRRVVPTPPFEGSQDGDRTGRGGSVTGRSSVVTARDSAAEVAGTPTSSMSTPRGITSSTARRRNRGPRPGGPGRRQLIRSAKLARTTRSGDQRKTGAVPPGGNGTPDLGPPRLPSGALRPPATDTKGSASEQPPPTETRGRKTPVARHGVVRPGPSRARKLPSSASLRRVQLRTGVAKIFASTENLPGLPYGIRP